MKVAKLVTFSITTRVIVDENDPDDLNAIRIARENILTGPASTYVVGDNVSEIEEDEECPYGTFLTDKDHGEDVDSGKDSNG